MEGRELSPLPRSHFDAGAPCDVAPLELPGRVSEAVHATRDWLLARQHAEGYWCGELEGDSILESEYLLLLAWLAFGMKGVSRRCRSDMPCMANHSDRC